MIKLDEHVVSKLKSSYKISNVFDSIVQLVYNSIDANATEISIKFNYSKFFIEITDNGDGCELKDLQLIGDCNITSKIKKIEDLRDIKTYGYHGEALFDIITLSKRFEITSRKSPTNVFVRKTIDSVNVNEKEASVEFKSDLKFEKGTHISIFNLFYNIPIKQLQVDEHLEFQCIKRFLEQISVFYYDISIQAIDLGEDKLFFESYKTSSVKNQFSNLLGIQFQDYLKPYCKDYDSNNDYDCKGLFSIYSYSASKQFIFLNKHLIENPDLYTLVNKNLSVVNMCPKNKPNYKSPVYAVFITCSDKAYCLCEYKNRKTAVFIKDALVKSSLKELIDNFLVGEGFRLPQEDSRDLNNNHVLEKTEEQMVQLQNSEELSDYEYPTSAQTTKRALDDIEESEYSPKSKRMRTSYSFHSMIVNATKNEEKIDTCQDIFNEFFISWFDLYGYKLKNKVRSKSLDLLSDYSKPLAKTGETNETEVKNESIRHDTIISIQESTRETQATEAVTTQNTPDMELHNLEEKKTIWDKLFHSFKPKIKRAHHSFSNFIDVEEQEMDQKIQEIKRIFSDTTKWRSKDALVSINNQNTDSRVGCFKQSDLLTCSSQIKLDKLIFKKTKILGQFDLKFILGQVETSEATTVLLFDQHACHERVRLELLVNENLDNQNKLISENLNKPLKLSFQSLKSGLWERLRKPLQNLGISFSLTQSSQINQSIQVTSVPKMVLKRILNKAEHEQELTNFLQNLISNQMNNAQASVEKNINKSQNNVIKQLPREILDYFNSDACRSKLENLLTMSATTHRIIYDINIGAVKFGDELSRDECKTIIKELSECVMPFQCAHGRPTVIPLIRIKKTKPRRKKLNFSNLKIEGHFLE